MSDSATSVLPPAAPSAALPFEPAAESPLLNATHLFLARPEWIQAGAWARGADGYEQRELTLSMRLAEHWKGPLAAVRNAVFPLRVVQRRVNEWMPMEPPDLWSARSPDDLSAILVVAVAGDDQREPAALMRPPAARALLAEAAVADVRAAIVAERLRNGATEEAGMQALLAQARENAAVIDAPYGTYLWDRLRPLFGAEPMRWANAVIPLLAQPDASRRFRITVLAGLQHAVLDHDPEPQLWHQVLLAYFQLLALPECAFLREDLINLYTHNLVFDADDKPVLSARDVFADPAERARLVAVLVQAAGERAERLRRWLQP